MHPEVAFRSCDECTRYLWNPDGSKVDRFGIEVRRPPGSPMECGECPKLADKPIKTRFQADDMDETCLMAYRHFQKCRAVGRFEDDAAVESVAAIVHEVEAACGEYRAEMRAVRLEAMLAAVLKRR